MDFYIFRHGQTFFSKNEIPYGNQVETAEILNEAIPVVKRLANYLKNIPTDVNFTSPYKRCIQTAKIIEEITGKKFTEDARIHDFNSESIDEMVQRIRYFWEYLKEMNYKSVAICTHGYPLSVLKSLIMDGNFNLKDLDSYPKSGVLTIFRDKKMEIVDFN